ncbi:MAG: L,D-transpeptidase [Alphaproteobacteria bacterium]|nr:L,D-transpeptidase [Alphaproteobacteria bacterium]
MITRRHFVGSGLAAGASLAAPAFALANEPFKIDVKQAKEVEYKFQRQDVSYEANLPVGTIVVDSRKSWLFHVTAPGKATRYGVSLGKSAHAWSGVVTINKMAEWPIWIPAPYHIQVQPNLAKYLPAGMPGGPENPLGARALYLYKGDVDTVNRIHGAAKPEDIGEKRTAGCIGMLNVDVIHLYATVQLGTKVLMLT